MSGPNAYAAFRPRSTRLVCVILAGFTLVAGGAMFALRAQLEVQRTADVAAIVVLVASVWAVLYRVWSVQAVPTAEGLVVRNTFRSRRLAWAQIVGVRLGDSSWAQLDLADGTVLAVMAIQRADGEFGQAQARRLATLVAAHEAHGMDSGSPGR